MRDGLLSRGRRLAGTLLVLSVLGTCRADAASWISNPRPRASQQRVAPWVIAHRGASADFPESTMLAFREAIRAGADAIELDCQTTSDGKLVVLHDDLLDRTTDGRGPVSALSWAQVERLDAGRWKHARFAGARVPTLEQVVRLAMTENVGLVIEAKTPYILDPGLAGRILELLDREGATSRTILQSFDHRPLTEIHARRPEVKLGPLVDAGIDDVRAMLAAAGTWAYLPHYGFMLPDRVRAAHRLGYHIAVWTVDRPEHMLAMTAAGVDGIMTNRAGTLRRLLDGLRLPRRPWPR